jgi:hypothetical protein
MLQDGHKALEAMSAACSSMKSGEWGEAERSSHQVQDTVGRLRREVGDKVRDQLLVPRPDTGDRE